MCCEESNWSAEEEEDGMYSVCVCSLCAVYVCSEESNKSAECACVYECVADSREEIKFQCTTGK